MFFSYRKNILSISKNNIFFCSSNSYFLAVRNDEHAAPARISLQFYRRHWHGAAKDEIFAVVENEFKGIEQHIRV